MRTCDYCKVGQLVEPQDKHPSYLVCNSCMAMELTYEPQDYQEEMHTVSTGGGIDIVAVFGKQNLPN